MSISGCTSCQLGSSEALKAYDTQYQLKLNTEAKEKALQKTEAAQKTDATKKPDAATNQAIAGASLGGQINLSV